MIKFVTGVKIRSGIKLKNSLSLGGNVDYGELPATFTISAGYNDLGAMCINFSEPVTVTMTGGVTLRIAGTDYYSGDTIPVATEATDGRHVIFIKNPGEEDGTITFGKRKQVTYLYLSSLGSSPGDTGYITVDITGMKLTYLQLYYLWTSVITGDITGMPLTHLYLYSLGSSVAITGDISDMELTFLNLRNLNSSSVAITGDTSGMPIEELNLRYLGSSVVLTVDITGMPLIYLNLYNIDPSVITGDITGMELTSLLLDNLGSSLTYGTNPLNRIMSDVGIQLIGDTMFATAAEYEQLIMDAAAATWSEAYYSFVIESGTNDNCPNWDDVKADVATLLTKANWTTIPPAWLEDNGGTWPANWNYYTGDEGDENPDGELPATFSIPAGYEDIGMIAIGLREPVTLTITGGVTLSIGSTEYYDGDTIPVASGATGGVSILTINNPGAEAGSITFGKREQIIMLGLQDLGSSVITVDITGMNLMALMLVNLDSSVITGDITGMNLAALALQDLGSSVAITGDITGMGLYSLMLVNLSSSSVAITGDITGMELDELVLEDIGSCVITGT